MSLFGLWNELPGAKAFDQLAVRILLFSPLHRWRSIEKKVFVWYFISTLPTDRFPHHLCSLPKLANCLLSAIAVGLERLKVWSRGQGSYQLRHCEKRVCPVQTLVGMIYLNKGITFRRSNSTCRSRNKCAPGMDRDGTSNRRVITRKYRPVFLCLPPTCDM